ncbi:MAG TPA: AzlD domain-containing protein [Acidimicrobiales bacterium]|nr:AzlD domain-containing protein [Acidimicrobiales bacterium]
MTATAVLVVLAAGTYALKSAAPLLLGGRELPWLARLGALLPAGLLAALVVVSTFSQGHALHADARAIGLAAAAVALVARAPFWAVVLVAVAVTALARAI